VLRLSYALLYYIAAWLLGGAVVMPMVFFARDVSLFERSLIGDVVSLLTTVAGMSFPVVRQWFVGCLASIGGTLNWADESEEELDSGPWLTLGACFVVFYLIFIALNFWRMAS